MEKLPERDWKVFSRLQKVALDRKCREVLVTLTAIINDETKSNHDRYGTLYGAIHDHDKDIATAFNGFSRSMAPIQLLNWKSHGLITEQEFAEFSEETRQWVIGVQESFRRMRDARRE